MSLFALLLLLFLTPRLSRSISSPVLSHKVIQAHAASMENVLKSISIEGRGATGELHRTSSLPQVLTFRTSLRRFLTGSDAPHTHPTRRKSSRGDGRQREGEGELFDEEELARSRDPGGMSVLLMSQELSLESNQEAFLRRFTASQVPKQHCLSSSLALPLSLPLSHFFIVTQCLSLSPNPFRCTPSTCLSARRGSPRSPLLQKPQQSAVTIM
jgi:hypothetical protein